MERMWLSGNLTGGLYHSSWCDLEQALLLCLSLHSLKMGTLAINPTQECCSDLNINDLKVFGHAWFIMYHLCYWLKLG